MSRSCPDCVVKAFKLCSWIIVCANLCFFSMRTTGAHFPRVCFSFFVCVCLFIYHTTTISPVVNVKAIYNINPSLYNINIRLLKFVIPFVRAIISIFLLLFVLPFAISFASLFFLYLLLVFSVPCSSQISHQQKVYI